MNETELTTLLERGARLYEPDVDALVAGGAGRGRRSLRRRRVGAVSVAALATAGIAAGGVFVAGGAGPSPDASLPIAASGSPASPTPPSSARRVVDTDDNGPVVVTARLRPIAEIHADIQRALGPGASDPLQGPAHPVTSLDGDDLSWFFRVDDAEANVSVEPFPTGCTPSQEQPPHTTGCLKTAGGVEYRTFGPWTTDGPGQRQETVEAWHHGFEIMLISTNVHQDYTDAGTRTVVAENPTITLDQLVSLATSDIWFQPTTD